MSRVVSIWLPFWKTDRLEKRRAGGSGRHEPDSPLAVVAAGRGGKRVIALNSVGLEEGLRPGMLLTDACAMLPMLTTTSHEPEAEHLALKRLAAACNRFSPWTAPDEPDGLWIEATGLARLFDGEDNLLRRILGYLHGLGLTARVAMAGTPGAAWALARFGRETAIIAPPGEEARAIAPLPVKALRLDADSAALLDRLGLKTVGQLLDIPRASLRARFGKAITCRLDQALGADGEALSPLTPEPVYAARAEFADPLTAPEGLERTACRLIEDVAAKLAADGKGARRFTLQLFDTQNGMTELAIRMARAGCEPGHITTILKERLASFEGRFDPASGFDAVALYALGVEPLHSRQTSLLDGGGGDAENWQHVSQFLDRVTARLGTGAVTRFAFKESHWPERAARQVPAFAHEGTAAPALAQPRPLTLLPRPEPITAIAAVPDYPPRQFVWRRCHHRVTRAEGPERMSPEWWHAEEKTPQARDYYVVEDEKGRRFWLYREGVYGADGGQHWFMHGLFP